MDTVPQPDALPPFELAGPGPLRDRLVAAVLSGAKTATSSLVAQYHDEPLPTAGERFHLVDSDGAVAGLVEVREVLVIRLADVDLQTAVDEGEGFASVAEWRLAHERFWSQDPDLAALGTELTDDSLVVVERFRLVR